MREYYPKLLVVLQFGLLGGMAFWGSGIFASIVTITLFALGVIVGIWALLYNRIGNFSIQPKMKANARLITTGIYRYIRHPMYLALVLIALSALISTPTLIELFMFMMLVLVLLLKARREEMVWIESDSRYVAYKEKTKFFIPFIL